MIVRVGTSLRIEVVAERGRLVLTIVHDERELPVN